MPQARTQSEQDELAANFQRSQLARRERELAEFHARKARAAGVQSQEQAERLKEHENELARASFQRYGKWTIENFEPLQVLGQGSFGTVTLVRHRKTQELFALKQMEKARFAQKNFHERAFWERDAQGEARGRWSVELFATFQDSSHLFMVMEFAQGGDLGTHLFKKGRFSNEEARFYTAELIEAADWVHQCGMVHRDLKPDNIVLTAQGHLKLLDFGLCKCSDGGAPVPRAAAAAASAERQPHRRTWSVVGTPQYMAPETFVHEFGRASDLWAVGVIAYECLTGVVPFHHGSLSGREAAIFVGEQVLNYVKVVPALLQKAADEGLLARDARNFLAETLCAKESRLTAEGMRRHDFFAGLSFQELHLMTPPIVPKLASADDTKYFSDFKDLAAELPAAEPRLLWDRNLAWAGFAQDLRGAEALRQNF